MPGKWRVIAGIAVLVILSVSITWLAWPSHQQTAVSGKLSVVAAENFWGDIAIQLGGSHVHVISIINNPNADPHLYESNAQDAAAVGAADVVIVNGLGYDDFMGKLLGASPNGGRTVLTIASILDVSEGANQHLWYDIPNVPKVANKITDAYIAKDPAHANDYRHSLSDFDNSMQGLEATIAMIKQKYVGTPVAYTEPVPGYALQVAGLDIKTPEGFAKSIEDGDDPSPADANAMGILMTSNSVRLLLYNSQATSPVTEHIKALAKQAGIPVIGVSETLPANEKNYQSWQQDQLNQLLQALGA